ncbi:leucine-rich repeat domain-containing protein [Legionella sp. D16C41]|uniref:leucine-rich repeat domain-containing protein n=1 Tax=Legionella sp. D16C41 TaxID=3402688 RepID=UPI003AF99148
MLSMLDFNIYDIQDDGSYTTPDHIVCIGDFAFTRCNKLVNITISRKVLWIGCFAFSGCNNLESLVILDGLGTISGYAFSKCSKLKTIILPISLISIGEFAFYDCESLENLTLSSGLTSIGQEAFNKCPNLKKITLPTSITSIGNRAFDPAIEFIIVDSDNKDEVERITQLLPKDCQNKVITRGFANTIMEIQKKHLAQFDYQTPQFNPFYQGFFNSTPDSRTASCWTKLPTDLLRYMNRFLHDKSDYYKEAEKLIENQPWPRTNKELKDYEVCLKKIIDEQVDKAIKFIKANLNDIEKKDSNINFSSLR